MLVLGIDPGSRVTGWGLVAREGSRWVLRDCGLIRLPAGAALHERLAQLHAAIAELCARHRPEAAAIEAVFHGVNTRSLVTLGQARGAAMAAVGACRLPLTELSPAEIKKAVTGRGQASKEQVAQMVGVLLGPQARARLAQLGRLDASDALAVALAALHRGAFAGKLAEAQARGSNHSAEDLSGKGEEVFTRGCRTTSAE